jgi:hypothetical protein
MRGGSRKLSGAIWRNDWNEFVYFLEFDNTGLQRRGFKIFKK